MIPMKDDWTPEEIRANRKAWVELLRSGTVKQGKYRLCQETQDGDRCYCIWGAACLVFGDSFSKPSRIRMCDNNKGYDSDFRTTETIDAGIMPAKVSKAMGLIPDNGCPDTIMIYYPPAKKELELSLWSVNDDGRSFDELANLIEANKFTKSVI
jgi:hypothetical protein